jgi:hypothetical protein
VEVNVCGACICQSKILHAGDEQSAERGKDEVNKGIVMGRSVVNKMEQR